MKTVTDGLRYFSEDHAEARSAFLASVDGLERSGRRVRRESLDIPSERHGRVAFDAVYLPPREATERLVIHTTGIHGIEGFVGGAALRLFLEELAPRLDATTTGHLLVHGINAYGMMAGRRFTESNVDLNRNFSLDSGLFAMKNEGYAALAGFLMPEGPADPSASQALAFYARALASVVGAGRGALRDAILKGQYAYPDGPYYGGSRFEPHKDALDALIRRHAVGYRAVLALDYHSAFGRRGRLHLFAPRPLDAAMRVAMERVFRDHAIDWPEGDFYETYGDFNAYEAAYLSRELSIPQVVPMSLEYGTLNNLGLVGALESLRRVVLDCQGRRNGYASPDAERRCARLTRELYYPSAPSWRRTVMAQTRTVLEAALMRFDQLELG